jgi:hypothetical protein
MLLNELLKEHRKWRNKAASFSTWANMAQQRKDFKTAIMKLRKDMETVVARLQEQADNNSRMSDRVER